MSSEKEEVLCPLCYGHGREREEVLVLRWRSREFQQQLEKMADEAAFGSSGGLEDPFARQPVYSNERD
ncbi:MAG TPA: hypothetical protein VL240_05155 [Candidatus Binatia bacterium]|nr:hypothetical protein [Candidatus Binatia bacterium]